MTKIRTFFFSFQDWLRTVRHTHTHKHTNTQTHKHTTILCDLCITLNYIKNCLYIYYVLSRVEGSAAFHSNSPITFNAARLILESASLRTLRRHHHVVSGTPSLLHRLRYAISRHAISRVQVPRRSAIARRHPLDAIPSRSSSPSDYIDCGPSHP